MTLANCLLVLLMLGLPWSSHENKKSPESIGIERIFIDIDRATEDKLWLRINNDSKFHISVMNLGAPEPNCPNDPEYYLERVVQRKLTAEDRKAIEARSPAARDKTDDELDQMIGPQIRPTRMIAVREERLMNWSDAIAIGCGDLGPQQKASFEVPIKIAMQYEKLYLRYRYEGENPKFAWQAPEHRLYFDLSFLRHPSTEK